MQLRSIRLVAAAALLCALATTSSAQSTIHVDASLTTGANDGSSWADALQTDDGLRQALLLSTSGDRIFVKEGTYYPTTGTTRTLAFNLKNGVEIFGGFAGGETEPDQRPPFGDAPTVLSGDLNENDGSGVITDNSYHVVNGLNSNSSAVLDGFVVTGGNANAGGANNDRGGGILCLGSTSSTIRNCHFIGNRCNFGGGAGYINGAPSFTDVVFEDNFGGSFGGAFDIAVAGAVRFDRCTFVGNSASRAGALEIFASSGVVVTNCVFHDNTATGSSGGGAVWLGSGGTCQFRNNTVVGNTATATSSGGLRDSGSNITVANCIFWDNTGTTGTGSTNQIQGTAATYCIVQGGLTGTGNLVSTPMFADLANMDFRLMPGSPAIDAGSNSMVPSGIVLDADRTSRIVDDPLVADTGLGFFSIVDIGAFENSVGAPDTNCAASPNTTLGFAVLTATGSAAIADNGLNLFATGIPANEFGIFVMSRSTTNLPVASGWFCLGAPQYRFTTPVLDSGTAGTYSFTPDLNNLPQGQVLVPGETVYFQAWHRDGTSANFTSSLGVTFE